MNISIHSFDVNFNFVIYLSYSYDKYKATFIVDGTSIDLNIWDITGTAYESQCMYSSNNYECTVHGKFLVGEKFGKPYR